MTHNRADSPHSPLARTIYRKPVEIPVELEPDQDRVLIQAFLSDEAENAIPMDQVLWYAGDLSPMLMLPEGRYRIVAQSESGEELGRVEWLSE